MDFNLSENQISICKVIQKMCIEKLNDNIFTDDGQAVFPIDKWYKCGEIGLFGIPVPEEYGGNACDMLTTALAMEAFGYSCKDEGLIFSCIAHIVTCCIPLMMYGTENQKKKYLHKLASGDFIGGSGMTETNAGSDFTAINSTVSVDISGNYILDGAKIFVTNAPVADILIIYAKHPGGLKMLDTSAFILEKDAGDFRIGQVFEKMGLRTSPASEVLITGSKLENDRLLGRERLGMQIFNDAMLWERILLSAYHVGAMKQQYEEVLKYANTRKQYGKKLIEFEGVYNRLVNMKIKLENSRLMMYKVCWDFDNGRCSMSGASMLKLFTSESKLQNSLDAVHIFGAYGYIKESAVEKQLRDSVAASIYSGTSEIQKLIIAKSLEELND